MTGLTRVLIVIAGLFGAAGVALAAAAAHVPDAGRLGPASSMLLFHASAVLAATLLAERGLVHRIAGLAATFGLVVGTALFAGDLTLRQFAGHGLFPMAAPTGGTLLIASWLLLGLAGALAPRR
ncbi:DUF423 domain-containing protein [Rhodopseudomonas palustris]|uniref:DUF423 domain-containing protein n=1 Tax=Rhodopseudomonas TaxID=1073 RepID=UPI0006B92F66|nr:MULTISPECIES: DUF423 domain-containing protein [Rhodopseudomonas]KPF94280.1 hypothetical protein IP86_22895 [Rhodopseudomonas sp. AAP120]MCP9628043.1 DUF423 domain-containing protein [Rhodopseudomonas palustris]